MIGGHAAEDTTTIGRQLGRSLRGLQAQPALLDRQAAVLHVQQAGALGDGARLAEAMPSCSHRAVAPTVTACRATSASTDRGGHIDEPDLFGTSARDR